MKIILIENIDKVGKKGETVAVKRGYARNYLLPRNLAIIATPKNLMKLQTLKTDWAAQEARKLNELKTLADQLGEIHLTFIRKTDENDHMFGSVSESDIVIALKERNIEIQRSMVQMERHIKELGESHVSIKLHKDICTELPIIIVKEAE
ncbi:MAG: 50S ribosomal protein L9 [Candidatus Cloacimonetes bacterium]|nr:50S ribosomal protein L9 [Candidatus Cloacimonadota bacterium]